MKVREGYVRIVVLPGGLGFQRSEMWTEWAGNSDKMGKENGYILRDMSFIL